MTQSFFEYGDLAEGIDPGLFIIARAKMVLKACLADPAFEVLELRKKMLGGQLKEAIIIECKNHGVPTKNSVGIRYIERLALVFSPDSSIAPEVLALRKNFPITLHQNAESDGSPASLCLYLDWVSEYRVWTPQKFLQRVMHWLEGTSKKSLHATDQPIERLYFKGIYQVTLPSSIAETFDQANLMFYNPGGDGINIPPLLRGTFAPVGALGNNMPKIGCLILFAPAVEQGPTVRPPGTLGALNQQLTNKEIPFLKLLCDEVDRIFSSDSDVRKKSQSILLILQIPVKREKNGEEERQELQGFYLPYKFDELGISLSILLNEGGQVGYNMNYKLTKTVTSDEWEKLQLQPIEIQQEFSQNFASEMNGLGELKEFFTVLGGVGALGGALANIWCREAWGKLALVDHDYIQPHNLARHIAIDKDVGLYKVNIVKRALEEIYPTLDIGVICDKINNFENQMLKAQIQAADLVVDATTSIDVPRDLVQIDLKRIASVFLTPSGHSSVLLLEDAKRKIKIDVVEAQYYRAILSNSWGEKHLQGHYGHLVVGGGCRDISRILSNELIQLHASILARQVRLGSANIEASIQIWNADPNSGAVEAIAIECALPININIDEWTIVWDISIQLKLREERKAKLPNETGGVLLGYFDHKLKKVYVVDALSQPKDSFFSETSFVRGVVDDRLISDIRRKTGNLVSYIGEWHSHPEGVNSLPSEIDLEALQKLKDILSLEGDPALMLIVGEDCETWLLEPTS